MRSFSHQSQSDIAMLYIKELVSISLILSAAEKQKTKTKRAKVGDTFQTML